VFGSLDFIYTPAADVDRAVEYYVSVLSAELVWKIRDGQTVVAHVRLNAGGPAVLLANHLDGDAPIHIYRVDDLKATIADLRARGWTAERGPFELPPGPCVTFRDPNGQRLALYQLVRPNANEHFAGRNDQ
jgi:predicted enzyme related to lactoylglutathione lyase